MVSQSCGLKKRPLVQQTSSSPAVTWRTVNELLLQSPLCQVCCATFPEAFTLLPSLGDDRPGRLDFQKTSLVPSHWTGQYVWAPEAFTLLSHWTGQDGWSSYKTARTVNWQLCRFRDSVSVTRASSRVVSTPLFWDLEGVTSTDRTAYQPTFPSTGKFTHTKP